MLFSVIFIVCIIFVIRLFICCGRSKKYFLPCKIFGSIEQHRYSEKLLNRNLAIFFKLPKFVYLQFQRAVEIYLIVDTY